MKFTLSDIKDDVAEALSVCSDDARVAAYVNESQERLILRGKWVGCYMRYRVCLNNGCITWPREIETIEAFAVCDWPGPVRNEWFEFNENGFGLLTDGSCPGNTLIDRGEACSFDDITKGKIDRKIKVYSDVAEAEDGSARITLQGYDENGNWIRTFVGGAWIDGEQVTMNTTGTLSTKNFSSLVSVLKPVTLGNIRLYEYETTGGTNFRSLAIYEPDETRPLYRRSLVPGLGSECCVSPVDSENGSCNKSSVTVLAKLRHIPVAADNDWLMLRSPSAIRLGVMAILKEKKDLLPEAETYWGKAIAELQRGLAVYQGDGAISTPRVMTNDVFGGNVDYGTYGLRSFGGL